AMGPMARSLPRRDIGMVQSASSTNGAVTRVCIVMGHQAWWRRTRCSRSSATRTTGLPRPRIPHPPPRAVVPRPSCLFGAERPPRAVHDGRRWAKEATDPRVMVPSGFSTTSTPTRVHTARCPRARVSVVPRHGAGLGRRCPRGAICWTTPEEVADIGVRICTKAMQPTEQSLRGAVPSRPSFWLVDEGL
ncbi:unnamed protein product, partial [Durusdinium trenchii]